MEQFRGYGVGVGLGWHGIAEPWVGTGGGMAARKAQSGLGSCSDNLIGTTALWTCLGALPAGLPTLLSAKP
jgi:hypothetical protein